MSEKRATIAVTGATGFVGRYLCEYLRAHDFRVLELRRSAAGDSSNPVLKFTLGEAVATPGDLADVDLLVHAAHDYSPLEWDDICRVNLEGAKLLLAAAREAEVKQILFVSTMAAFNGCKSNYGRVKMRIEDEVIRMGGMAVRPGLMWGPEPGGLIGALRGTVGKSRVVPLVGGGSQVLYLNHLEDFSRFVAAVAAQEVPAVNDRFVLACDVPWTFRRILTALAASQGNSPTFLPVPWKPLYVLLKGLEKIGMRPAFRSDSLLSLMNQDPSPDFDLCSRLPIHFRDFDAGQVSR